MAISVRHSVAQAYGLLFGQPLTIIGLSWLPATAYAIAAGYLIQRMDAAAMAAPALNGLLGGYALLYFATLLVATALFGALIAVPLSRQAFGLREERVAAHLVVGIRELRMFLALLRYYVVVVGALVVLAVAAGITISQGVRSAAAYGAAAGLYGIPLETWLNSAAGAAAVILFSILAVRYGFLLSALAAAEDEVRLGRAAALSRENFWTIMAIMLIVGAPVTVVFIAAEMTFGGFGAAGPGLAPANAMIFAGILAAGLVILHALSAGASAGAYSEMAEAAAQESGHVERAPYRAFEPAMVSADMRTAQGEHGESASWEFHPPPTTDALSSNTEHVAEAPTMDWVPPPDAHFGSDPHDAQPDGPTQPEAAQNGWAAAESLPTARMEAERLSQNGVRQPADALGQPLDAEFLLPPLERAGAMAAQSGFHTSE